MKFNASRLFSALSVILLLFSAGNTYADIRDFRFDQIPALSTLPNNEILTLMQDSDGFIWIATKGGLYKYDGYDIKEYRSNLYNPDLLSDNWISALAEDDNKQLYIGTKDGLNILNKKNGEVRQCTDPLFRHNYIAYILPVSEHEIWTATNRGLIVYDPLTNQSAKIDFKPLRNGAVKGMLIDSKGEIWVGTWNKGLFRYSPRKQKWTKYPQLTPSNSVHVLFEDSRGRLWAGTFGEGLVLIENQYDTTNLKVSRFTSDMENGLSDNFIYAIIENPKTNTLWVGTRKGISITQMLDSPKIDWEKRYPSPLMGNDVDALINDRQGNIWIGSLSGVSYVNISEPGFRSNPLTEATNVLKSASATSIMVDNNGRIWTGVGSNGISIFDPRTGKEEIHHTFDWSRKKHTFSMVPCMLQSETTGDILLGTVNGIYAQKKGMHAPSKVNNPNLTFKILDINEIKTKGYLVCGTHTAGFLDFDLKNFHKFNIENYEYSCGIVYNKQICFIGSSSNGIFRIDLPDGLDASHADIISHAYNIENGRICSDNITDLYLDSQHRLWVATDGGGCASTTARQTGLFQLTPAWTFPPIL